MLPEAPEKGNAFASRVLRAVTPRGWNGARRTYLFPQVVCKRGLVMTRKYLFVGLLAAGGFVASPARANDKDEKFKMMDTNGDGKISADEFAAHAKQMFEKMDADKNGKITAAEMDAAHAQMAGKKAGQAEMASTERIKMMDTNGDGVLSEGEWEAGSKKMFEKMDTDHDGYLTKAELEAGHKAWMQKKEK
jgi:Ca2+-binding EF-hand superfamily protein